MGSSSGRAEGLRSARHRTGDPAAARSPPAGASGRRGLAGSDPPRPRAPGALLKGPGALPCSRRSGRIQPVAEGPTFARPLRCLGCTGGPAQARAPACSAELAPRAERAVRERLGRVVRGEIEAPALRCLEPKATTLEAAERDDGGPTVGAVLLHRRLGARGRRQYRAGGPPCPGAVDSVEGVEELRGTGRRGRAEQRGGPTLECGHPRSRPMLMSDVPLAAKGGRVGRYAASLRPALAGS